MNRSISILTLVAFTCLAACGGSSKPSPTDSKGQTPEATFTTICELLIDGKTEETKAYYSPKYLEEFVTNPKQTIVSCTYETPSFSL